MGVINQLIAFGGPTLWDTPSHHPFEWDVFFHETNQLLGYSRPTMATATCHLLRSSSHGYRPTSFFAPKSGESSSESMSSDIPAASMWGGTRIVGP